MDDQKEEVIVVDPIGELLSMPVHKPPEVTFIRPEPLYRSVNSRTPITMFTGTATLIEVMDNDRIKAIVNLPDFKQNIFYIDKASISIDTCNKIKKQRRI